MAHQVFISYSSQDKSVADAACAALEAQRIACWIAPRHILAGREWGEAIVEAISQCRVMVLVFSAHANSSPQVRREVERAINKGKIIVPFRIVDVLPSRAMEFALSNTHWLDALTPPLEKHLNKLAETVSLLVQQPSRPPEAQQDTQSPAGALAVARKYCDDDQYDRALPLLSQGGGSRHCGSSIPSGQYVQQWTGWSGEGRSAGPEVVPQSGQCRIRSGHVGVWLNMRVGLCRFAEKSCRGCRVVSQGSKCRRCLGHDESRRNVRKVKEACRKIMGWR
jgi:hypothetical protein